MDKSRLDYVVTIGCNLYKVRNALGLKQTDLSDIISQSNLSKVENGEYEISSVLLYLLAKRYNKPMEYFFEKHD